MVQILRPSGDVTVGSWRTETGATSNLSLSIDETVSSTADYVYSTDDPDGSLFYEFHIDLGGIVDPESGDAHIVTYDCDRVGSATINVDIQLRQGAATVIDSWTETNITTTLFSGSHELLVAEANAITDYTDLRLRFTPSTSGVIRSFAYLTTVDQIRTFDGSNPEYARSVTAMDVIDSTIFPAYGDSNTTTEPGIDLVSVHPSTGVVTQHLANINTAYFSVKQVGSDAITVYWDPIGNSLTLGGVAHRVAGTWSNDASGDLDAAHLFDAVFWNGDWYLSGELIAPGGTTSSATVWKSTDDGATWAVDQSLGSPTAGVNRAYSFFPYDDRLYIQQNLSGAVTTGGWWLPTTGGAWTFDATQRPLSTGSTGATVSEVRRFGSLLFWHGTIAGKSLQTNTGEFFPTAITSPNDLYSVPLDRSATQTLRMDDIWTYDITGDGTRMYVLGQDNLVYTSTDGTTFTSILTGEKLPDGLRSIACVGNDVFLGDHGGTIYKSSSTAWSTTDLLWETFHDDPSVSRGWTKVDASTPQLFFRGSQLIKSAASTAGGSVGVPRLFYATPFTRASGLTCEFRINKEFLSPRYHAGFILNTGVSSPVIASRNIVSGIHFMNNSFQIMDYAGGQATEWPGREYRVVLEATGSVMYMRGFTMPAVYDDREASRGDWIPLARERANTTASVYAGFSFDGAHPSGVNIGFMRVYAGDAPAKTISDTFTRADGAIGTAETGGAYTTTGTWTIATNQAASTDTSGIATYARLASGISDGLLEVTVSGVTTSANAGLVFRYVDATNYWRAYYNGTNFVMDRTTAGVVTTHFTVADAAVGGTIAVCMLADKVSVHRGTNGTTYCTTITDSAHQTATSHGLMTNQVVATARWDNLFLFGPVVG